MDFEVRTVSCEHVNQGNKTTFNCLYSTDFSVRTTVLLAQFSRRDSRPYTSCTVQISYSPHSHFLAQKSRQVAVWEFWKVWHGFQGGCTTINAPRNLLYLLARISRQSYNHLEAQKSRSRPIIYCRKFSKEF
jgi:hypothetical protein